MSKITQEKKTKKNSKKTDAIESKPKQKKSLDGIPNIGKCCTCKHFPGKMNHETMPCKILGKYVARKAEHPECYKCKFEG